MWSLLGACEPSLFRSGEKAEKRLIDSFSSLTPAVEVDGEVVGVGVENKG